jgi:hypothetical protein
LKIGSRGWGMGSREKKFSFLLVSTTHGVSCKSGAMINDTVKNLQKSTFYFEPL